MTFLLLLLLSDFRPATVFRSRINIVQSYMVNYPEFPWDLAAVVEHNAGGRREFTEYPFTMIRKYQPVERIVDHPVWAKRWRVKIRPADFWAGRHYILSSEFPKWQECHIYLHQVVVTVTRE